MTRIALTGTPGAGKTAVARHLGRLGAVVVTVEDLARTVGATAGHDAADGADVIDVDLLHDAPLPDGGLVVVDGHLSHHIPVDAIWVLRCDPKALYHRLTSRGYGPQKVLENCEAEAMDLILQESLATARPVVQRDTTHRSAQETTASLLSSSDRDNDLEPVDWSDRLPFRGP